MPILGVDKVEDVQRRPEDAWLPDRPDLFMQDVIKAKIDNI
jgi:hypothetical protein